jgi:hypothetical protein
MTVVLSDSATRVFFGHADRNFLAEAAHDEATVRHLGDDTRSDGIPSLASAPEGATGQSVAFSVTTPSPRSARIVLDVVETMPWLNEVWLNGQLSHGSRRPIRVAPSGRMRVCARLRWSSSPRLGTHSRYGRAVMKAGGPK